MIKAIYKIPSIKQTRYTFEMLLGSTLLLLALSILTAKHATYMQATFAQEVKPLAQWFPDHGLFWPLGTTSQTRQ